MKVTANYTKNADLIIHDDNNGSSSRSYSVGIANGVSVTEFAPDAVCTRA